METAALVAPVTALEFIQDEFLLSGEGPLLTVFSLRPRPNLRASLSVLQHQRIHGIRPRASQEKRDADESQLGTSGPPSFDLAVFGGKAVRLVRLQLSDPLRLENSGPVLELADWILDVGWTPGDRGPLLCVALAHNSALLLDAASGSPLSRRSCSEGCLLYSALVLAHEAWSDTVIVGGTVFNQLVVWKPGALSENPEVECRLLGHSGVIFAISYLQNEGVIASASDDRSVRIWQVGNLTENGGRCKNSVCLHVLYGHQARVFSVKLSYGKVFSAGEDGACLMWENGKVMQTLKGHRAGGVRALAISAEEKETWIATGGADGGIRLWKLGMRQDKEEWNNEKLVDLRFPNDKMDSCERKTLLAKQSKDNMGVQEAKKSKSKQGKKEVAKNIPMDEQATVELKAAEEANSENPDDKDKAEKGKKNVDVASVGVPKVICTLESENSTWSDCSFVVCTDKGGVFRYNEEKWELIWQGPPEFQSYCVMEALSLEIKGVLVHLCAVGNLSGSVQVFTTANPKSGTRLEAGNGKIHTLIWQKGSGVDKGVWLLASGNEGLVYRWRIGVKRGESLEITVKEMDAFLLPVCAKRWLTAAVRTEHQKEVLWVCGDRRGSLLLYREEETEVRNGEEESGMVVRKSAQHNKEINKLQRDGEVVAGIVEKEVNPEMVQNNTECQSSVQEFQANMLIKMLNKTEISQENSEMQTKEVESVENEQALGTSEQITVSVKETEANMLIPSSLTSQDNKKVCDNLSKPLAKEKLNKSIEEQAGMLAVGKEKLMLKLTPASVLFGVHGKQGVTSVFHHSGLFYSTGRDGCVRIFRVCSEILETLQNDVEVEGKMPEFKLEVLRVQRACKGMEWLEKLLILDTKIGQEVEDCDELEQNRDKNKDITELDLENFSKPMQKDKHSLQEVRFAIVGFHGGHFVVWDPVRQERLLSVECGGGHRSWSLWTDKKGVWEGHGELAFIKQGAVLALERTSVDANANGKLGWTLREGIHGRGIGCVCRLGRIRGKGNAFWEVVVTGGEDTSVTVLALNPENGEVRVLAVVTDHVSSVRALATTTAVTTAMGEGREGDGKSLTALVVSAGGRAQMQCCRLLIGRGEGGAGPSCQVIQVAAHRLDEQWERKRNRHKMVKMDPETRYMSMAVLEEASDSVALAVACSDGAVRLFSVSERKRAIDLSWESFHHQRCVLSVATCCLEDTQGNRRKLLFSAATDGQISVWDFASFSSSNQIAPASPTFTFPAHQSGVSALSVSPPELQPDGGFLLTVVSGGDDGRLSSSGLSLRSGPGGGALSVRLQTQSSVGLAHAAPLTALKLLRPGLIVSASCDQRVSLWRACSARLVHQGAVCTHVADAAGLEVWEDPKSEQKCGSSAEGREEREVEGRVLVCGQGLQLLRVRNVQK